MIFRVVNDQCLVADVPVEGSFSRTPEDRAYYDGWLVAESCASGVLPLLQAAPEMLEFLRDLTDPTFTSVPPGVAQRAAELVARAQPSAAPAAEYHPVIDEIATTMFGVRFTNAADGVKRKYRQLAHLVDVFAAQPQADQLRAFLPFEYGGLTFRDLHGLLQAHGRWQDQQAPVAAELAPGGRPDPTWLATPPSRVPPPSPTDERA